MVVEMLAAIAAVKQNAFPASPRYRPVWKSTGVTASESLYPSTGIDDLLFPGIKGMTFGTDFQVNVFAQGGTGFDDIAATACGANGFIIRVDIGFHQLLNVFFR